MNTELGPELKIKSVTAICPGCGKAHRILPKDGERGAFSYAFTGMGTPRLTCKKCKRDRRVAERRGTGANYTRGQEYEY